MGSSKEGPIRSAPAFTMAGRQKALIPKNLNFPGPGTYDAKLESMQHKAPQWTCAPRMKSGSLSHMNPGPGVYCPEKVRSYIINIH